MLTTTRGRLGANDACEDRYAFLCTWAPEGDEAPIPLEDILENNGIEDAIWALRALDDDGGLARWFARWCAAQVVHLWDAPEIVREYLRTGDDAHAAYAARAAADASRYAADATHAAWTAAYAARYASHAAADVAADVAAYAASSAASANAVPLLATGHKLAWAIRRVRAGKQLPRIRIPTSAKTAWR